LPTSLTYIVQRLKALNLGDLLRIWVRPVRKLNHSLGFSRDDESAPDTAKAAVLYGSNIPIARQSLSREYAPYKEKRTLPGTPAVVSEFVCVTALSPPPREGKFPQTGSGILTRFPFAPGGCTSSMSTLAVRPMPLIRRSTYLHPHLRTGLAVRLGPPDPCSTAVHMEPFSTSVHKVLTCILATTTKICTCGSSTPPYDGGFHAYRIAHLHVTGSKRLFR
jgi:hypothetical protein